MLIDQSEIDALLAAAGADVGGDAPSTKKEAGAKAGKPATKPLAAPRDPLPRGSQSADVQRLLRLRVPLIVRLATRKLPLSVVRQLSTGSILEFDAVADAPLDLLIRNRAVGKGDVVKIDENFGVRILEIKTAEQRIRSMGV